MKQLVLFIVAIILGINAVSASRTAPTSGRVVDDAPQTFNPMLFANAAVSLTYNFKAGKAFRKRSIESGAAEQKGRL